MSAEFGTLPDNFESTDEQQSASIRPALLFLVSSMALICAFALLDGDGWNGIVMIGFALIAAGIVLGIKR